MTEEEIEDFIDENEKDYKKLFLLLLFFLSNKISSDNKIQKNNKYIQDLSNHFIENNLDITKNFFKNIITLINIETNKQADLLISDKLSLKQTSNIKEEILKKFSAEKLFVLSRNELGKINFFLTREIFLKENIESYIWQTQLDERVRISHRFLEGKICSLVDPTVYKSNINDKWTNRPSTTTNNHCGMDFNCRCYMLRI